MSAEFESNPAPGSRAAAVLSKIETEAPELLEAGSEDAPPNASPAKEAPPPPAAPPSTQLDEFARERAKFREEQEAFKSERASLKSEMEQIAAQKAEIARMRQEMDMFFTDPVGALEAMGADESTRRQVVQRLNWAEMGEDALPEYKASNEVARLKREQQKTVQELKAELAELKAAQEEWRTKAQQTEAQKAQERVINEWRQNIESYVTDEEKMGARKNLKVWAANFSDNPQDTYNAILGLASELAEKKKAPPSLDEVMDLAEERASGMGWVKRMRELSQPQNGNAVKENQASPTFKAAGNQSATTKAVDPDNLTREERLRRAAERLWGSGE